MKNLVILSIVCLMIFSVFGIIFLSTNKVEIVKAQNAASDKTASGKTASDAAKTETGSDYGLTEAQKIPGIAKGTIPQYVGGIINAVVGILGVILVALIIYGGVLYMTSAGSEEQTKTAKNVLTYAIIGIVIIFAAYLIAKFVLQAVSTSNKT